jgi:SDR family mycofactocin-dependent oxidoreductase
MAGRMVGKVAFVTGCARGQGRSHALRLAEEGADIIGIDICAQVPSIAECYPLASEDDLAETVALVEKTGRSMVASVADVRDYDAVKAGYDAGVERFGPATTVVGNAGVCTYANTWEMTEEQWDDVLDINLKGMFNTVKATVPSMIEAGKGGSIIMTSSTLGLKGFAAVAHYAASKHGVIGLMRSLANELADQNIRVNTVNPTAVDTTIVQNEATYNRFSGHDNSTQADAMDGFYAYNSMHVPWVDPIDISNGVLFLASDEARYVTGTVLSIDAGSNAK